jgi:hypothetical protein
VPKIEPGYCVVKLTGLPRSSSGAPATVTHPVRATGDWQRTAVFQAICVSSFRALRMSSLIHGSTLRKTGMP